MRVAFSVTFPNSDHIERGKGFHDSGQLVAVAAAGLVTDLEAVRQGLEDPRYLIDGAELAAVGDLPALAEDADRDALVADIEPDPEHFCVLSRCTSGTQPPSSRLTD
jgi:hypothetical protein